jgi:hypothetical protein
MSEQRNRLQPAQLGRGTIIIIIIIIIIIMTMTTHTVQLATCRGKEIIEQLDCSQHKFLPDETSHRTAPRYAAGRYSNHRWGAGEEVGRLEPHYNIEDGALPLVTP